MGAKFEDLRFAAPFVLGEGGVRSLHFTIGETQSSMRCDRPDELQIDYTRTMMGFLLLQPAPREILMIGLGGGSMAKFCHRHLASARVTVVENNPAVIELRREFRIPDDDERLSVIAADGAAFLREFDGGADALLVDAFDEGGQPPALCSQAFYDDCRRALAPGGVLVVNLHVDDTNFARAASRRPSGTTQCKWWRAGKPIASCSRCAAGRSPSNDFVACSGWTPYRRPAGGS
jgi:spermidine synthase